MSFLNTGRYQIYYEIVKNAVTEPTVFLHGNLASSRWFKPALKEWTGLKNHSALLIDWRGCGMSDSPKTDADMHPDQLAQDINAVLDFEKWNTCSVVGHSTGGLLALVAAAQRPERYRKIVALDPVGAQGVKFDPALEGAFIQMAENKDLAGQIVASTIHGFDMNSEIYRAVIREDAFIGAKKIGLRLLKNLGAIDYREDFKKITSPTLVLHGEKDVILDIEESKKLTQYIPQSTFEMIANHGHCTNIEDAAWFAQRTQSFLID